MKTRRRMAAAFVLALFGCSRGIVETDLSGERLLADTVVGVTPAAGAADVSASTAVILDFSETMEASSLTTETVSLRKGSEIVAGGVSVSADGKRVTFTPSAPLAPLASYTVRLDNDVTTAAGEPFSGEDFTSTFTTRCSASSAFDDDAELDCFTVGPIDDTLTDLAVSEGLLTMSLASAPFTDYPVVFLYKPLSPGDFEANLTIAHALPELIDDTSQAVFFAVLGPPFDTLAEDFSGTVASHDLVLVMFTNLKGDDGLGVSGVSSLKDVGENGPNVYDFYTDTRLNLTLRRTGDDYTYGYASLDGSVSSSATVTRDDPTDDLSSASGSETILIIGGYNATLDQMIGVPLDPFLPEIDSLTFVSGGVEGQD